MERLTLKKLLSIWKSESSFDENIVFTLSFKSDMSIGALWYVDLIKQEPITIVEDLVEFTDNQDDTYILTIGSTIIKIRLYMPHETKPSFIAYIPEFGEITLNRVRGEKW